MGAMKAHTLLGVPWEFNISFSQPVERLDKYNSRYGFIWFGWGSKNQYTTTRHQKWLILAMKNLAVKELSSIKAGADPGFLKWGWLL